MGAGGAPTNCGKPGHAGAPQPGDPNCNVIVCSPEDAACIAEAHGCRWVSDLTFTDCAAVRFASGEYASRAWVCPMPGVAALPTCEQPAPGTPNHDLSVTTWCCLPSAAPAVK
jgi:hypothetical protein